MNIKDTVICSAWKSCSGPCRAREPHDINRGCNNKCPVGMGARCVPTLSADWEPPSDKPPEKLPLRKILIKGTKEETKCQTTAEYW